MRNFVLASAFIFGVMGVASAQEFSGINADLVATTSLSSKRFDDLGFDSQIGVPIYNNIRDTFAGVAPSGGAALQSGNTITKLLADDIVPVGAGGIVEFWFTVGNLNSVAVSARPRVRFYADNAGAPGTLLGGITYNPIAFTANSANVYFTSIANVFGTPLFNAAGPIWAGITFDNNVGGTGATAAQLDNLGQLVMNPPTVGTSADQVFLTTAAGSNFVSSPAGATFNYGGNPRANLGWKFNVVPEPGTMLALAAGLGALLARRRKKA
ncbi:MAG TPA: PEP-CTERM sorting domain-containing protein [Fimbriimonadaceae bacterium]|nr:PEP-CTERM sorting domain-containing protein [Fimbriimonadaceae bacterium]